MPLQIANPVLALAVVLVGRFTQNRRSRSPNPLEVRVHIGDVQDNAPGAPAGNVGCCECTGRLVQPEPPVASPYLAVKDLAVVLDEPPGLEAEDIDEEVMSRANVPIRKNRDRIEKVDRHRPRVEPRRHDPRSASGSYALADTSNTRVLNTVTPARSSCPRVTPEARRAASSAVSNETTASPRPWS